MIDEHSRDKIEEYEFIEKKYKGIGLILGVLFLFIAFLLE